MREDVTYVMSSLIGSDDVLISNLAKSHLSAFKRVKLHFKSHNPLFKIE